MSITNETFYTAYAMTSRGREEIECYKTVEEAIQDMLELWPEDDEGDIIVENVQAVTVVYMARSITDPNSCHVYQDGKHIGAYHCHYEPSMGGSVRTVIKRLV